MKNKSEKDEFLKEFNNEYPQFKDNHCMREASWAFVKEIGKLELLEANKALILYTSFKAVFIFICVLIKTKQVKS